MTSDFPSTYDPNWKAPPRQPVNRSTMWYDLTDSEGGFDGTLNNPTEEQLQNMKRVYQSTDSTPINMSGKVQWSDAAPYEMTQKESQQAPTASGTSSVTTTVPVVDSFKTPPASGIAPVTKLDQALTTSGPASAVPVTEGSNNIIPGKTAISATTASVSINQMPMSTSAPSTNAETVSGNQSSLPTSTPALATPITQTGTQGTFAADSSDQLPKNS